MLVSVFKDTPHTYPIETPKVITLINGVKTSRSYCKGYCDCDSHPGFLDEKTIRLHKCHEKECNMFYKFVKNKKTNTHTLKKYFDESVAVLHDEKTKLITECRTKLADIDGIAVTDIVKLKNGTWQVRYVSICSMNKDILIDRLSTCFTKVPLLFQENWDWCDAAKYIYNIDLEM